MKELSIGDRIRAVEEGSETTITIDPSIESWKMTLLFAWLVAWTASGLVIVLQLLSPQDGEVFIFILVYLAFWSYFEYKIVHAWLWRKWGSEVIKLDQGNFLIKRDIRGYGKVKTFFKENIRNMRLEEFKPKSFAQSYSRSFWVVGGETILFNNFHDTYGLGLQLEEKDSKNLLSYIKKRMRR